MNEDFQRAGDSVHEIMARYSHMVYRLAYARTGNRADADDVFQDVFFKYFAGSPRIESEEHLKAWLIRTTIHTSVNLFRSAWRRRNVGEIPEIPAREEPQRHDDLRAALKKLPEKYRVVLYLHYYEELSTEEIAAALAVKPATIRSQLARGRARLKDIIERMEAEEC